MNDTCIQSLEIPRVISSYLITITYTVKQENRDKMRLNIENYVSLQMDSESYFIFITELSGP